jgi:hypothetical protein
MMENLRQLQEGSCRSLTTPLFLQQFHPYLLLAWKVFTWRCDRITCTLTLTPFSLVVLLIEEVCKVLDNIDEQELEVARKAVITVEMGHFDVQFHGALSRSLPKR